MPQSAFWNEKPAEELYDLLADPDEVNNLADRSYMQDVKERMSRALRDWQVRIRDLGFLPEGEIHERAGAAAPYSMGHDDYRYPMRRVMRASEAASSRALDDRTMAMLRRAFQDSDSAVRYWAATGALIRKEEGVRAFHRELYDALADESPYVRVVAAEALGRFGAAPAAERALSALMDLASTDDNSLYVAMEALNALDYLDERAAPAKTAIAALPREADGYDRRLRAYVPNFIDKTLADLE
jgi:uncharacterized sulfatase